jgi:hypothetical protein
VHPANEASSRVVTDAGISMPTNETQFRTAAGSIRSSSDPMSKLISVPIYTYMRTIVTTRHIYSSFGK